MGIRSEYTEDSVYDDFVGCAVRILDAERKFDIACSRKDKDVCDIIHLGQWSEKCRDKYRLMVKTAKSFGLEYSNDAAFTDARRFIKRTDERIAEAAKCNS